MSRVAVWLRNLSAGVVTREIQMQIYKVRRQARKQARKQALQGTLGVALLVGVTAWPAALPAQQSAQQSAQSPTQSPPQSAGPAQKAPAAKTPAPKTAAAKKAPAAKLDPTAAQGEVENGMNALAQGRAEVAVGHLTTAISAGSLPSAQSARALYYRGVAYRRNAKPAQAISDLTNALWIKGGLTDEQRADALQQRSGAYREAGLPDQGDPQAGAAQTGAKANPKAALANATPFSAVAPSAPAAAAGSGSGVGNFFSSIFGGGSSAPAQPALTPVAAPAATAASSAVVPPSPPANSPPAKAATAPPAKGTAARPPASSSAATVAPPAAAAAVATTPPVTPSVQADGQPKPATRRVPITADASSSNLPYGFQDLPSAGREVEVSTTARAPRADVATKAWDQPTEVKPAPATRPPAARVGAPPVPAQPAPVQAAATTSTAPAAPAKSRSAGGPATAAVGQFQIQVAATRNAEEARGLATRLQTQFARELGGRAPIVEQSPVGTSGPLYRVSIGPFTSARDTESLCARLKGDGLDCRISTP